MKLGLALLLFWVATSQRSLEGYATYYEFGVMEQVAKNRNVDLDARYYGGVALNRKGNLFRDVWLKWKNGDIEGPFLAIDCANRMDLALRLEQQRVVEVDAQTAVRRGFYKVGPTAVKVYFFDVVQVQQIIRENQ